MRYIFLLTALVSMVSNPLLARAQLPLPRFAPNDVLRASDLNAIVDQLELLGMTDGTPPLVTVDCGMGETITQALAQAIPGTIIRVAGTCNETVLIMKDGITLDGQGAAIIDGGGPTQSTIIIDGAQRVTLQGLTAQNGDRGIVVRRGAAAILVDVTATGNRGAGGEGILVIDNATARFQGTITSMDNADDGIQAIRGGNVFFDGTTVQLTENGDAGLNFNTNGHGTLQDSTFNISGNTGDGMRAGLGSAVAVSNVAMTLSNNRARGLSLFRGASVEFRSSSLTVTGINTGNNNNTDGIGVTTGSSLLLQDATAPIVVNSNGARGVLVSVNANLTLQNSRLEVTNNTGDGLGIFNTSRCSVQQGGTVFSENNTIGINVADTSSFGVASGNTLTVQNNRGVGLALTRSSSASLAGTTMIVDNADDGIDLTSAASASLAGNVLLQGNGGFGIELNRASTLTASGVLNIADNDAGGIAATDLTFLRLADGATMATVVIELNSGPGIQVRRTSQAVLGLSPPPPNAPPNPPFDLRIRNNTTGILVNENSHVSLNVGTMISANTDDGLQVRRNSGILANNISVTGNTGNGLDVEDGSIEINNSMITGNMGTDIIATFGAKLSLSGNTIGTPVACDNTVLRRVNGMMVVCP